MTKFIKSSKQLTRLFYKRLIYNLNARINRIKNHQKEQYNETQGRWQNQIYSKSIYGKTFNHTNGNGSTVCWTYCWFFVYSTFEMIGFIMKIFHSIMLLVSLLLTILFTLNATLVFAMRATTQYAFVHIVLYSLSAVLFLFQTLWHLKRLSSKSQNKFILVRS